MRSFFVAFVVTMACTIALSNRIEVSHEFRDPVYGVKLALLRRVIRDEPNRPTIVVLGSSRVEVGFDGLRSEAELAKGRERSPIIFNFGFSGAGPMVLSVYLERLLEAGILPDTVVIEALSRTLEDNPLGPPELQWIPPDRFSSLERLEIERKSRGATGQWPAPQANPWSTASPQLLFQISPFFVPGPKNALWDRPMDRRGLMRFVEGSIGVAERESLENKARLEYQPHLASFTPTGVSAGRFRQLIVLCQERKISVRIVLMPEATNLREWYGPGVNERYLKFLHESGVSVVDARDWVPDSLFADGHHLLTTGAAVFIDRFTAEVFAPWTKEIAR